MSLVTGSAGTGWNTAGVIVPKAGAEVQLVFQMLMVRCAGCDPEMVKTGQSGALARAFKK